MAGKPTQQAQKPYSVIQNFGAAATLSFDGQDASLSIGASNSEELSRVLYTALAFSEVRKLLGDFKMQKQKGGRKT